MAIKEKRPIGTSVKIDPDMHAAITRAAKERGVSTSEFLRLAAAGEVLKQLKICPLCGHGHKETQKSRHKSAQAAA
jgi:uncharacterized protein (DUF1778 family)